MTSYYAQCFDMELHELRFDSRKAIIICSAIEDGQKQWAKRLADIHSIDSVIEDERCFYLSCESEEIIGQYMALNKIDGSTLWFIPGKAFMSVQHEGFLYLIFSDQDNHFYLLKVEKARGTRVWHYHVSRDLKEYSINQERVLLTYESGKTERLSAKKGTLME